MLNPPSYHELVSKYILSILLPTEIVIKFNNYAFLLHLLVFYCLHEILQYYVIIRRVFSHYLIQFANVASPALGLVSKVQIIFSYFMPVCRIVKTITPWCGG